MGSSAWLGRWRPWRGSGRRSSREDPWAWRRGLAELGLGARDVAAARPSSERDMRRMMRLLGLSPEEVPRSHLAAFRDGERVCAHCTAARRCRRYLAAKVQSAPPAFCPNLELFCMLRGAAGRTSPSPRQTGS